MVYPGRGANDGSAALHGADPVLELILSLLSIGGDRHPPWKYKYYVVELLTSTYQSKGTNDGGTRVLLGTYVV